MNCGAAPYTPPVHEYSHDTGWISREGVSGNDFLDGGLGTDTRTTDSSEKSIVGFP